MDGELERPPGVPDPRSSRNSMQRYPLPQRLSSQLTDTSSQSLAYSPQSREARESTAYVPVGTGGSDFSVSSVHTPPPPWHEVTRGRPLPVPVMNSPPYTASALADEYYDPYQRTAIAASSFQYRLQDVLESDSDSRYPLRPS